MSKPPIPDAGRRLRFTAIVLWSAFLGAATMLLAWLACLEALPAEEAGFGNVSRVFLVSWAVALVPALCAALLATPDKADGDRDG